MGGDVGGPPDDPLLGKAGKGRTLAKPLLTLVLLSALTQAAEPLVVDDLRSPGWSATRVVITPGDGYTALAAAPGATASARLDGRLPLGSPSLRELPWLQVDLAGAEPAVFAGLSLDAAGRSLLRDADLPGRYVIDLTAALPAWVGQAGPLPLGLALSGATADRPGPVTRFRSLQLLADAPNAPALVDEPEAGWANLPDGCVRQGDPVLVRAGAALSGSVAGPPRRPLALRVEEAGDGRQRVTLPDGLRAGPGEVLLSCGGDTHLPLPWAVDTRAPRPARLAQPVGVSPLRPTLDGALGDRAWRDAVALPGLGRQARVLLLAMDDGLAIATRLQRPDGQPPRATVTTAERPLETDDHLRLDLRPAGADGPACRLEVNPRGTVRDPATLTARVAVPGLPLLGAADGGWQAELIVPWAALGDVDAARFELAFTAVRPGCEPALLQWPGEGLAATLSGLPDLSAYRLPSGEPSWTVAGAGEAARLVVVLPLTNRTGRNFAGVGKAALEREDGLTLAESGIDLDAGETGRLRWEFKPGRGAATLLWRLESDAAPTLRRTGRARL